MQLLTSLPGSIKGAFPTTYLHLCINTVAYSSSARNGLFYRRRFLSLIPSDAASESAIGSLPSLYEHFAPLQSGFQRSACSPRRNSASTLVHLRRLSSSRISLHLWQGSKRHHRSFVTTRIGYRKRSAFEIHHIDHSGLTADQHWLSCTTTAPPTAAPSLNFFGHFQCGLSHSGI